MHPILATRITDPVLKWKPVVALSDVKDEKETYRVRFSICASTSTEPTNCIKVHEKNGSISAIKDTAKKGQNLVTYL